MEENVNRCFFLMETLCQGVWVGFANSAVDAGVEKFSLPKKEMPKKSRAYIVSHYSKILQCTIVLFQKAFSVMGQIILPYVLSTQHTQNDKNKSTG